MRKVLGFAGFVARVAANREQIVAALRQPPLPDLVLLDVMLPDTDGFNVLARMRQHPLLGKVPVIMVTGTATREAVLKGLLGGANGYITKPFQIDVLLKAVKTVLGIEASDQEAVPGSILNAAESALPGAEAIPAAHPAATPVAPASPSTPQGSSRLAQLKQLAQAKQTQQQKPDAQPEIDARVSRAVEKAYRYLKEFTDQLNILKPAYPKEYAIVGMPNFDGLIWDQGKIDLLTRESTPTTKLFDRFTLEFRLSAGRQLRVVRDSPEHEKLKQMLLDNNIAYSSNEERNERGKVARASFVIPCEVKAVLQLAGNFKTGKLLLRTRNVERFGLMEYVVAPEAITDESLDELTGFILGESTRIGPLLVINA
ncbi:MAG: hypothetical protein A3E79_04420 [Burkholderiales bacterium RIFCSPHIGHO2_12_FULL_61_11]|nr:MAG: hypothetical protein A3E79_04420 [Burkholderiales bacterium RIFCSPHIGHO2_12_FULL_61_11]